MINADISPYFQTLSAQLAETLRVQGNLFGAEIESARQDLSAEFTDTDDLIGHVLDAVRMVGAFKAGVLANGAFRSDFDALAFPAWKSHKPIEGFEALQVELGHRLCTVPKDFVNPHANLMIGEGSNIIMGTVIEELMARKVPIYFTVSDDDYVRLLFKHMEMDALAAYAQFVMDRADKFTHRIIALPNTSPPARVEGIQEKQKRYAELVRPLTDKSRSGSVMSSLTYYPVQADAEIDQIPLNDYLKMYFEMCDQPDTQIRKANDFLISKLNNTTVLRFTNDDGTDVSMELVDHDGTHFTFANSQTVRNIPGSEVFSAPRLNSTNGTIVGKGRFSPKSDRNSIIENLTMVFEGGYMTSWKADKGVEHFEAFLNRHDGNRRIGEIGIGTNPHLKHHVVNGLLVEKIGGSFHVALGDCYTMTDYLGTPVHMNNGNNSTDHWDVTTMLYGHGGRMYLDGEMVMEDGKFLAPELDVLNRGWNAIPVEDRPERWKDYKGPFTGKINT